MSMGLKSETIERFHENIGMSTQLGRKGIDCEVKSFACIELQKLNLALNFP
jgi:hypothetical protein